MADPASWAAIVASMEALAAETMFATAGEAVMADAMLAAAPAAAMSWAGPAVAADTAAMAFGSAVPTALEAGIGMGADSMMAGLPWAEGIAAAEAGTGLGASTMTRSFPWENVGKAAMKGLAMGQPPEPVPRSSGGRPQGGGQAQQIPAFDYGSPTVQMPSMTDLMKKREEMLRRRMARGY